MRSITIFTVDCPLFACILGQFFGNLVYTSWSVSVIWSRMIFTVSVPVYTYVFTYIDTFFICPIFTSERFYISSSTLFLKNVYVVLTLNPTNTLPYLGLTSELGVYFVAIWEKTVCVITAAHNDIMILFLREFHQNASGITVYAVYHFPLHCQCHAYFIAPDASYRDINSTCNK